MLMVSMFFFQNTIYCFCSITLLQLSDMLMTVKMSPKINNMTACENYKLMNLSIIIYIYLK